MLEIEIEFDAGRFHATPWRRNQNEGAVEWPPSPWRLLRALAAAHRLRSGADGDDAAMEDLVSALREPPEYVLPPAVVAHRRHYMPAGNTAGKHRDAGTRDTSKVLDTFVALGRDTTAAGADPSRTLVVRWSNVSLGESQTALLDALLPYVTYLGRAESWCTATRRADGTERPANAAPLAGFDVLDASGTETVSVLCAAPAASLEDVFAQPTQLRARRLAEPSGAQWVTYRRGRLENPAERMPVRISESGTATTFVRFEVRGNVLPSVTRTAAVADLVRAAAMRQSVDPPPAVFSGRASADALEHGTGHRHAHFLPTDEDGDGRIDHVTVWAPGSGFTPDDLKVLAAIERLRSEWQEIELDVVPLGFGSDDLLRTVRAGWTGHGTTWRSATPFFLLRHPRTRALETTDGRRARAYVRDSPVEQVRRELERAGFPHAPEDVDVRELSERAAEHRTRGSRTRWSAFEDRRKHLPRGNLRHGFELVFAEPQSGPIVLGSRAHFGLGVFEAVPA